MENTAASKRDWLAPTSLGLGILGFLLSPFLVYSIGFLIPGLAAKALATIGWWGLICSLSSQAAVLIGTVSLAQKRGQKGQAIWGVVFGAIGLLSIILFITIPLYLMNYAPS